MKNLEIKAKVKDIRVLELKLRQLGAKYINNKEHQVDTYFNVPQGRFKLRKLNQRHGELIYYERKENTSQRWSEYSVVRITNPDELTGILLRALGKKVIIDKVRTRFQYQNARIFLDRVRGLGQFMEIEVVLEHGRPQAKKLMAKLLVYLQLPVKHFIKHSYSDLLLAKR